ncbi:MAG: Hsp20/alpha crystallin family protein [Clostridiales bacterium]|jgi:HSP20 family molecular chaperone IbpA|nr:Hsp20/alpha crystallin family protein [Clostridiales bacterium]
MKNLITRGFDNLFDDVFDSFFKPVAYDRFVATGMKTDIKDLDDRYELAIDVPGYEKEDLKLDLENGYLTVKAEKSASDEKDKKEEGRYLRRERSYSCSRTYYVGDVDKESVKAKYENGVLSVTVPKEKQKVIESTKIDID